MAPNEQPARVRTGVLGLDDVLHGGLIAGKLYLLEGNPGAGKTTMALQFLREGVRQGEACLYITMAETADELRAGATSHGWALEGVEIFELTTEERDLDGNGELTMYHPSEVELTETTRKVLEAVERLRPQRMVFDSLSEVRLLAQSSLRYRRQILALKQFFVGRQCTVLLLDDRTAEGADLQLQSIAHGVISLDHKSPTYGPALRQLHVVKFRGSDFRSGLQDFRIVRGGLEVFPRLMTGENGSGFAREAVPSGVESLDRLFGGGIDRGTATLLIGPPAPASRPWGCSSRRPPPRAATTQRSSPSRSLASCCSTAARASASPSRKEPAPAPSRCAASTRPSSRRASSPSSCAARSRSTGRASSSSTA